MTGDEETPDRYLGSKELIWSATTEEITDAQLEAMRTRDANASLIRPIPSRTALGYDHMMADADRTALLAEVDRLREAIIEIRRFPEGCNRCTGPSRHTTHGICLECGVDYFADPLQKLPNSTLTVLRAAFDEVVKLCDLEQALENGEASDGHHTHNELYRFRMVLHAFAVRSWLDDGYTVVKSRRHHDGEAPFGGGWFIVVVELPTGQASNHYREAFWDLFDVPEAELAPVWDGHTPEQAVERMLAALGLPRLAVLHQE